MAGNNLYISLSVVFDSQCTNEFKKEVWNMRELEAAKRLAEKGFDVKKFGTGLKVVKIKNRP